MSSLGKAERLNAVLKVPGPWSRTEQSLALTTCFPSFLPPSVPFSFILEASNYWTLKSASRHLIQSLTGKFMAIFPF